MPLTHIVLHMCVGVALANLCQRVARVGHASRVHGCSFCARKVVNLNGRGEYVCRGSVQIKKLLSSNKPLVDA